MTALVRRKDGNLRVVRDNDYTRQTDMAADLRGNGYRVLKIWSKPITDTEIDQWEYLNRD